MDREDDFEWFVLRTKHSVAVLMQKECQKVVLHAQVSFGGHTH